VRAGGIGLVVDSYGLVSIVADRGSAADELRLHAGSEVTLASSTNDDDDVDSSAATVRITPRGRR